VSHLLSFLGLVYHPGTYLTSNAGPDPSTSSPEATAGQELGTHLQSQAAGNSLWIS